MYVPKSVSRLEDQIIGRIDADNRRRPVKRQPNHRSPAACQFTGGAVTAEIAEYAENFSIIWRRRVLAARKSRIAA